MGSFVEEEHRFFDAQEDFVSISDAKSQYDTDISDVSSSDNKWAAKMFQYDAWMQSPISVEERRRKFMKWMRLSSDGILGQNFGDEWNYDLEGGDDRIGEFSVNVTSTSDFEDEFTSSRSSMSSWLQDTSNYSQEFCSTENFACRYQNLDRGTRCNVDQVGWDGRKMDVREVVSDQMAVDEEAEQTCGSFSSFQQVINKDFEKANHHAGILKRTGRSWLSRFRTLTGVSDKQRQPKNLWQMESCVPVGSRVRRVKVRHSKKQTKELSALFMGQSIRAHQGSILTMKFNPDGQYLASAGEDGIVRLWQVVEDERSDEIDIPEIDPSCVYFTVNHLSELKPLHRDREKSSKLKGLRKTSDSACIIFPPKVFRLLEKPLHEFHGHTGEILELSWSNDNYLLSASVDKTVRLWRVGFENCLKVFSHNNYVTCVQFNPVDSNYFVSGSIDGKVRIWAVHGCQVVDWTDIKDIVTAVCYRPDGQGGIIGSITGSCRFYNLSENHLQLDAPLCLRSKKKSPCKRVTGFQFLPQDSSKVMVTCADSQVRVLHGLNVIGKYKGVRNAGSLLSASFTSDGKHIVSACEDSNVYLWNFSNSKDSKCEQSRKIRSSERFLSNASVAVPWSGLRPQISDSRYMIDILDKTCSPACFSLDQELFLESYPKGSATWPEEKLPTSSPMAETFTLPKFQYKFLKSSCQSTCTSHAWGLVIVTAGWDGRIRSFHNYGLPVPI